MCSEGSNAIFIDPPNFGQWHDFDNIDLSPLHPLLLEPDGVRPALPAAIHPLHKARQVVHMGQNYRPMIRRCA